MFHGAPSTTKKSRPTVASFQAFEELQRYFSSRYRTKKVDVKEGSVVLILNCKTLRSISDVMASVENKDLLQNLQEISKVVSEEYKTEIRISADLHKDTVRKTLDEIGIYEKIK